MFYYLYIFRMNLEVVYLNELKLLWLLLLTFFPHCAPQGTFGQSK